MFICAGGRKETRNKWRREENRFDVRGEGRRGIDDIERESSPGEGQ